jgi:hypothetical protein
VTARKRKPARKNTRRARGRRTNRERPAAPYRTSDTATVRVIPPVGEAARTHTYATITREAGHLRRFRFRAASSGGPAPAESGNGAGRAPGTGPAATERDAS